MPAPDDNFFSPEFDQIFDTFDQLLQRPTTQLEVSETTLDALLSDLLEKDSSYLRNYYTEALRRAKDAAAEAAKPLSIFEQDVNKAVANLHHPDRESIIRCILKNQETHEVAQQVGRGNSSGPSAMTTMGVEGLTNIVDSMIGPDLIGVQPMAGPVGLLYSLQYRYAPQEKVAFDKESLEKALKSILEGTVEKKLSLDIMSAAVEACTRKCTPYWTIEAMQDLNAQHGIDIEAELRSAMASELAIEFDGEMLGDLRKLGDMGDSVSSIDIEQEDLEPGNHIQLRGKLGCGIRRACSLIARQTRRGAGNFIVVTPVVLSLLQMTKDFVMTESGFYTAGRMKVGIFQNSINVFVDAYAPNDNILVGYKGSSETDTGYFWAPYVLLMSGGVVVNASTFQLQTSFMTRYGKYVVSSDDENTLGSGESYYQTVEVNLPASLRSVEDEVNITGGGSDNVTAESRVEDFGGYNGDDNRGSKVETLGELPDLEYFKDPIMRVPTSAACRAMADEVAKKMDDDRPVGISVLDEEER